MYLNCTKYDCVLCLKAFNSHFSFQSRRPSGFIRQGMAAGQLADIRTLQAGTGFAGGTGAIVVIQSRRSKLRSRRVFLLINYLSYTSQKIFVKNIRCITTLLIDAADRRQYSSRTWIAVWAPLLRNIMLWSELRSNIYKHTNK